jgi:UDP-N-acetylmuramoylalanine--D-glutamate ligase
LKALVVGYGVTGQAVERHLTANGWDVVVVDDRARGERVVTAPEPGTLRALVADADLVVPSPGVPLAHPVYALAARADVPVLSEIELAYREMEGLPLVAVTGTNGKTTVTTLIAAMLHRGGISAVAAGNIGLPLIDAVGRAEVMVAEVSSFQLRSTETFHPNVAVWLNLSEDHLDWHPDVADYAAAKAKVWANQGPGDIAVVNADDPVVMAAAAHAPGRVVTFGLGDDADADWRVADGWLTAPDGRPVVAVADLPRALPHDLANDLAALAAVSHFGVADADCRAVLTEFQGLPHRVQLVSDAGGVRWYDDSKATTPASVVAALRGFSSVVLIAGGRNKGLDMGVLRDAAGPVRAVVAIGDAAPEVAKAFDGVAPVTVARSMDEAVDAAAGAAQPGDAVLLSPGCASFDWYGSYAERGDDFVRAVNERVGAR